MLNNDVKNENDNNKNIKLNYKTNMFQIFIYIYVVNCCFRKKDINRI